MVSKNDAPAVGSGEPYASFPAAMGERATLLKHASELRASLDALAASLAAHHRAELPVELIERGVEAVQRDDMAAMAEADVAFHEALYQASGNPLLLQVFQLHRVALLEVSRLVVSHSALRLRLWREHAEIMDAVARGDAALAASLAETHTRKAANAAMPRIAAQEHIERASRSSAKALRGD